MKSNKLNLGFFNWIIACLAIFTPRSFESAAPDLRSIAEEAAWVSATYESMTMDERLGQLFMIRAYSHGELDHQQKIEALIQEENIGGLCFFQGNIEKQAELTSHYQSISKTPLLISIDAEWGLGMRLKKEAISFPRQLTLGAISDNYEIYEFGREVARQLKRLGIHINFAPVVDINNNPKNPVINDRSFGEDRQRVTSKAFAYMKGMQDEGIIACAKHFPGHGDTDLDSHYDLPIINHGRDRLDSLELFPFKVLTQQNVGSIMIAHLNIPALDKETNLPSTLSRPIVTDLLKEEIGFNGLVITDALDMQGVSKFYESGELEARALQAGNDILLLSENVKKAKASIKNYLAEGKISNYQLETSVKKILSAKYRVGLTAGSEVSAEHLREDINSPHALAIKQRLYEKALTLVRNNDKVLPIENVLGHDMASIAIGSLHETPFQRRLDSYHNVEHYNTDLQISSNRANSLKRALAAKDIVVLSLHGYNKTPKNNYGLGHQAQLLIKELAQKTKVVLVLFGSPYILKHFDDIPNVLVAYENDALAQESAAQSLFGVTGFNGRLPIQASAKSPLGAGLSSAPNGTLGFIPAEAVGMSSDSLARIHTIAKELIKKRAAPGCQVLIAKDGRIVFHEAYGYHDYSKLQPLGKNDVFDLASITKVAATTVALMKLHDEGLLDLDAPLKKYFPEMEASNKEDILIRDILAHHGQLIGWIPFYESTMYGIGLDQEWYRVEKEPHYTLKVCEKVYLRDDYMDTIFMEIICSELRDTNNYRYSDLGFYIFDRLIQKQTGLRLDEYCEKYLYEPLGLRLIGFNPLQRGIPLGMIPPTERDDYFRHQKIQGFVHDMGAAMHAGVAGHAGLFSNAHDVAVLMQMLMNRGEYGGKRYISASTVDKFLQRHERSSRRALGFDMKELDEDKTLNMCEEASDQTFGHLGFTGTAAWADPVNGLVYVFLSNRTYPSMSNNILQRENYRPKIQSIAYKAITHQ